MFKLMFLFKQNKETLDEKYCFIHYKVFNTFPKPFQTKSKIGLILKIKSLSILHNLSI